MIKEFVSGKWYRYIGPGKNNCIDWNDEGKMDFLLDNEPHLCNEGDGFRASFFDSPDPIWEWNFIGNLNYFEEVEVNDEMVQIQKLENELARLKELVKTKKEKKIIYNGKNLYIGIDVDGGWPHLLSGDREYFVFKDFYNTEDRWDEGHKTGQDAIDDLIRSGFIIHEFSDALKGMKFFMKKYREYHKED